jgi:hypothetical protein
MVGIEITVETDRHTITGFLDGDIRRGTVVLTFSKSLQKHTQDNCRVAPCRPEDR